MKGGRVIVIGAGIGGLCAAIGLRRAGFEVVVYERAQEIKGVGAGLVLWANAIKALRKLGISEDRLAGTKVQQWANLTWQGVALNEARTGELEALFGAPTIALHRASLHKALSQELPDGVVCLGSTFSRFEQDGEGVTAIFEDGRVDRADVLIGADGIHSAVRNQMFPETRLRYAGYTAWRGVIETRDPLVPGQTIESWGRGARFGIVPIADHLTYWFATANLPPGQLLTPPENKTFLQESFRGWHRPIPELIEATLPEAILHNDIYDIAPMPHWSQGGVTLLGDSAHPTTPNLGQGACQAIESSLVLTRALTEEDDILAALERYERHRKARTAWITSQSRRIGWLGQWQNPVACAIRDWLIRAAPPSFARRSLEIAAGYDV